MFFRSILQTWLQNLAKTKLRDAAIRATKEQMGQTSAEPVEDKPKPCHLGLVFALGIESGCFEDLLSGIVTIRGNGFVIREGGLRGHRVVMILSGPGRKNATRATETLIDGHQPQRVVSAGFAGALSAKLKRNDILIADRLVTAEGGEIQVDTPAGLLKKPGIHRGTLLTVDRVVRLPREKKSLNQHHGALTVDMETFAVAEVCQSRQTPFSAIRVINDTVDEVLPSDVEHLMNQKTGASQLGAALGAICRRPASAKEMYQLRENALVASGRLAEFLAEAGWPPPTISI